MAHIRRKLEPDPVRPRYFITEPGMGYRFEAAVERPSGRIDLLHAVAPATMSSSMSRITLLVIVT